MTQAFDTWLAYTLESLRQSRVALGMRDPKASRYAFATLEPRDYEGQRLWEACLAEGYTKADGYAAVRAALETPMLDDIRARLAGGLYDPLVAEDIARLLYEVEAGMALATWLNDRRHWTAGLCPCCGFGHKLDGSDFHGTGCVLDAYNRDTLG